MPQKQLKKMRSVRVAAAETPNYMKSTLSCDARNKKSTIQPSFKPLSLVVRNSTLRLSRAICSSTTKAQMPLDSIENDVSLVNKLCPYTYCSLHGHKHATVPTATRRSLKTQKTKKFRGYYSSMKRKADKEIQDVVNELFIEIQSKLQTDTRRETTCDEMDITSMIGRINRMKLEAPHDQNQTHESCCVTSFKGSAVNNSELFMDEIQVIDQFIEYIDKGWQEETLLQIEKCEEEEEEEQQEESHRALILETESLEDLECQKVQVTDSASLVPREPHIALINSSKVKSSNLSRNPTKYMENTNEFNPQPPRFLPMQQEHEQEKVNLKHQIVKETKGCEEWMIDYALRKALRRMAPAGKRKVALVVAAFEAVILAT